MAKQIEQLKKITVKTCGAQPDPDLIAKLAKQGKGAKTDLLDVFGIVRRFKPGQSDKGDYLRFIGQFKAVNIKSGEQFMSAAAIFPAQIADALYGVMNADAVNDVQMAFRIGIKFDDSAATKYVYTAQSLIPVAENDPLALVEKQAKQAALPAPK